MKILKNKDLPDHVLEEITGLAMKMLKALDPFVRSTHPNLALTAFNFVHAYLVKSLIAGEEKDLEEVAKIIAHNFIQNVLTLADSDNIES